MNKSLVTIIGTTVVLIIFIFTFFYRSSIPKITNPWINIIVLVVIIIVGIVSGVSSLKKNKRK